MDGVGCPRGRRDGEGDVAARGPQGPALVLFCGFGLAREALSRKVIRCEGAEARDPVEAAVGVRWVKEV